MPRSPSDILCVNVPWVGFEIGQVSQARYGVLILLMVSQRYLPEFND